MHNPPHPGESVLRTCIEPLGLSITKAAEHLGVTRKTLSELVNGKSGISPEMAIRLSKVFGSDPDFWMRLQSNYDLWHTQKAKTIKVRKIRNLGALLEAAE